MLLSSIPLSDLISGDVSSSEIFSVPISGGSMPTKNMRPAQKNATTPNNMTGTRMSSAEKDDEIKGAQMDAIFPKLDTRPIADVRNCGGITNGVHKYTVANAPKIAARLMRTKTARTYMFSVTSSRKRKRAHTMSCKAALTNRRTRFQMRSATEKRLSVRHMAYQWGEHKPETIAPTISPQLMRTRSTKPEDS